MFRRPAKAVLGALLGWLARRSSRRVGVGLLYHGIADRHRAGSDELVPPTPPELFARQLAQLSRSNRVGAASELPAAVAARRPGGRIPVEITFEDDGWDATARAAVEGAGCTAAFTARGTAAEFWCVLARTLWESP